MSEAFSLKCSCSWSSCWKRVCLACVAFCWERRRKVTTSCPLPSTHSFFFLPLVSYSSLQLAGTVDLLPTVLTMAGAKIPSDRPIDGVDMSPILFENGKVSADLTRYTCSWSLLQDHKRHQIIIVIVFALYQWLAGVFLRKADLIEDLPTKIFW